MWPSVSRFNTFHLEAHARCRYDWVSLYDGDSLSAPLIGRYCGDVMPEVVKTRTNTLLVHFYSDASVAEEGFVASYRTTFGEDQSTSVQSVVVHWPVLLCRLHGVSEQHCGSTSTGVRRRVKCVTEIQLECLWLFEKILL